MMSSAAPLSGKDSVVEDVEMGTQTNNGDVSNQGRKKECESDKEKKSENEEEEGKTGANTQPTAGSSARKRRRVEYYVTDEQHQFVLNYLEKNRKLELIEDMSELTLK